MRALNRSYKHIPSNLSFTILCGASCRIHIACCACGGRLTGKLSSDTQDVASSISHDPREHRKKQQHGKSYRCFKTTPEFSRRCLHSEPHWGVILVLPLSAAPLSTSHHLNGMLRQQVARPDRKYIHCTRQATKNLRSICIVAQCAM
jgi:hypothetical protein